jgi:hypothetical protein
MHAAAKLLILLEVIAIGQFEGCDMRTVTGGCSAEALQRGGNGTSLDGASSKEKRLQVLPQKRKFTFN